jgi:phospholipid/cholesterol/gamma-HCH transport system ATP-binding protein
MIEFKNVSLAFGDHQVLHDFNFEAQFHEKIVFLGGSGAGKTTILKLMLGLEMPDEGEILIDGQDMSALSEDELRVLRRKFSIVFQEGALFDSLSVRENVAFCMNEHSNLSDEVIEDAIRQILRRVGVEHAIDLLPDELSGGMKRRVAIARAVADCDPRMILYDEPTTGLDPITADTICDLINELSAGKPESRTGFISVTHKVTDAAKIGERFIYVRNGRLEFDGNMSSLQNTDNEKLRQFINELFISEVCK